ncbi:hypothetical protein DMUE_3512 [Dictyocoela muelleri]|nr:hypothetical protein DMUE_3512 [Dictyocoela muelleri]
MRKFQTFSDYIIGRLAISNIIVSLETWLKIMGKIVEALITGKIKKDESSLSFSILTNTYCCFLIHPLLYFLLKNKDSSISTIFLFPFASSPPNMRGLASKWFCIISLIILNHSETAFFDLSRSYPASS